MPGFNLGPAELIIILAIALVVFGPKKLPEIGRGIGSAMREFTKARNDFMETLNTEFDDEAPKRSVSRSKAADTERPAERRVEYPETAAASTADALPYGGDFSTEGDSQPSFRTAEPEPTPREPAYSGADPYTSSYATGDTSGQSYDRDPMGAAVPAVDRKA